MKQIRINVNRYCLRATPFGDVAVLWSIYRGEPLTFRIVLSKLGTPAKQVVKKFFPHSIASSCSEINSLLDRIEAFLYGENIRFPLNEVRFDLCSPFQQRVLRAEHAIPRGRVSSYHLIAKHLGDPNGSRAVGRALATNPFPIVVPCHRAICSDGRLGGYQGGLNMKRTLLAMEGVSFYDADHVLTTKFFYADLEFISNSDI